VWDAATGEELAMLKAPETNIVQRACFSPDGTCIVAALGDGTARLWDAFSRLELAALRGHKGAVGSVGFSADGRRIVTASDDGTARLWDALIGRNFTVLRGHEGAVNNACFAAGGARVVTASDDRTARIWDVATGETGEEVARIALDATINGLSVHGGAIALGDGLGRIHVFNADEFLRADSPVGG
jgi:WD40 repeat protein